MEGENVRTGRGRQEKTKGEGGRWNEQDTGQRQLNTMNRYSRWGWWAQVGLGR